jgi:fibronectin type 3 domain-containing protein
MKIIRIIFIAVIIVSGYGNLSAQVVQSAPGGNLIWISPDASSVGPAEISRKSSGGSDFKKIGQTTLPADQREIDKRADLWQKDFAHLSPLSTEEKQELLDMANKKAVPKTSRLKYHPVAMGILGQVWYDKETPKGGKVSYRVSVSGTDKTIEAAIWPGKVKLPVPISPDITESPDRIAITWQMKGEANAEGFRIYRRTAMKGEFTVHHTGGGFTMNKDKQWLLIINDTLVEPLAMYEYRAVALDKLGNEGELSEITRARTRGNNVLPWFSKFSSGVSDAGNITLRWKLEQPQLARSINIYRSKNFDKDFVLIGRVGVGDSIYNDLSVEPNENQYYRLEVLMDEGSRTSSVVSVLGKSNIAVTAPYIITVNNEKGKIKINWVPDPASVYGYYVYTQSAIGSDPVQVSHLIAPDTGEFVHSPINKGGSYTVYYSVSAVGHDYKLSDRSTPVEVMVKGENTLSSPRNVSVFLRDGKVMITWKEQFSENDNISGYVIYRKAKDEKTFTKANNDTLNPRLGFFIDEKADPAKSYTYQIEVRDYYGATASTEAGYFGMKTEIMPPQSLVVSRTPSGVFLRWEQTMQPVKAIRIYRFESDQKAKLVTELKKGEVTYEDKSVSKGTVVGYYLTYIDNEGKESGKGVTRTITIK